MKVLRVIPSFYPARTYGGPIESDYRLCVNQVKLGYSVRVLTTDANGRQRVLDVEKNRDVEIGSGLSVRYCKRLLLHTVSVELLRQLLAYARWAEVVHLTAVYSFPTIPTLLTCRALDKPLVWSPRGALQRWEGSTRPMLKYFWESVCRAVAPSRLILHATSEDEARESKIRLPGVETVMIPNGVEIPDSITHVPGNGRIRLLYLGRLHPKKGIENLLVACKVLQEDRQMPCSLTIAGSGDPRYAKFLVARIEELELSQQVRTFGDVKGDDKRKLFERTDIVVVPSYTENFGMVVAEALAHGVPVIASKGTPWQRLEEMGCGLWVDNDPEGLARAIEQMSQMPLHETGHRGREWMAKEFAWPLIAEKMTDLYKSLLTTPS